MTNETPEQFYRKRIAEEGDAGEPELQLLGDLISGGTVVDVGANQGIFAFALSEIAEQVHAFEPHPEHAEFARRMLQGRATVYNVALSNAPGRAQFFIPYSDDGMELHLAGSLKQETHAQFAKRRVIDVEVRTLDSYALDGVTFIKVDVEGAEMEVLEGARATIARCRPILLLELLSGTHADPAGYAAAVCKSFGYTAFVVHEGKQLEAQATIRSLGKNTTWGTHISTRNVLFMPT